MHIEFDTEDIEKTSNRVAEIVLEKLQKQFSSEVKKDTLLTVEELALTSNYLKRLRNVD